MGKRLGISAGVLIAVVCGAIVAMNSSATVTPSLSWHASDRPYQFFLTAPVGAGDVGWCLNFKATNEGGSSCGFAPHTKPEGPILSESWGSSGPPEISQTQVVTTKEVADVSVDGGAPIPTRAQPRLPDELRAVLLEASGSSKSFSPPELGARDASGHPLPAPLRHHREQAELEAFGWHSPGRPTHGPCEISVAHVTGLTAQWGAAIKAIRPVEGLLGKPFLGCTDTEYYLHDWPLDVGVVLDATDPGTEPAPLPQMKPVSGRPGYYGAPGNQASILGRRLKGAWLLVEGGKDLQQRLTVLGHARAAINWKG